MSALGTKTIQHVNGTNAITIDTSGNTTMDGNITVAGNLTVDTNTLYVDSTNNNVGIGTSSPSGKLDVTQGTSPSYFRHGTGTYLNITTGAANGTVDLKFDASSGSYPSATFYTSNTERMRIDSSGRVGIGTTAPDGKLSVANGLIVNEDGTRFALTKFDSNGNAWSTRSTETSFIFNGDGAHRPEIDWIRGNNTYPEFSIRQHSTNNTGGQILVGDGTSTQQLALDIQRTLVGFYTGGTERMRIDSSGNVGIGTQSPSFESGTGGGLEINNSSGNGSHLKLTDSASGSGGTNGFDLYAFNTNGYIENYEAGSIVFRNNGSERVRIDSSGNLLVGTTNSLAGINNTDEGISLRTSTGNASSIVVSRDAGVSGYFNRNSDGDILSFRRDGSAVGSIGNAGTTVLKINGSSSGIYVGGSGASIWPQSDNTHDLGTSGLRFQDLYLSGGAYIGGTGSANYLDDYEEGTFTPTLLAATTNPTVTYTSGTVGAYTKIGNTVHVFIRVNTTLVSGGSGEARIGGLPFATNNIYRNAGALGYISGVSLNSGFTQFGLSPTAGASHIRFVQSGSGVSANIISIGVVANSFDITLTLTYSIS